MTKEELEKEAEIFVSEKSDKGNFDIEQFGKAYFSESSMKQALVKFTEQRKVHTEIEINGVRFSNISEMLQYMDKQREHIIELEKAYNEAEELLDKQIEATYKVVEENKELKSIADFQTSSNMDRYFQLKRSKEQLTYAKTIIQDLLYNTDEYARQRAEDFLKENK